MQLREIFIVVVVVVYVQLEKVQDAGGRQR
jgi:hypothetical protein